MKESTRTLVLALLCAFAMTACEKPAVESGMAIDGVKSETDAQATTPAAPATTTGHGPATDIKGATSETEPHP